MTIPWVWGAESNESGYKNLFSPDKKLRMACVGVGGKGKSDVLGVSSEDIVALCDVDFSRGGDSFQNFPTAARYRDFRQMFNEMSDQIDAVTVSTPDHMHYPIARMAMEHGKHVYVQKPLTHTIGEARELKRLAIETGVVTQMGNQGHANEGTRLLREWVEAGVIGQVTEVHAWTDRPIWPQGIDLPGPMFPPPPTLDWNLWLGVAPERAYNPNLEPFKWRGFWDYGCGALGDMGCHLLDAPFWALNLRGLVKVTAQGEPTSHVSPPRASQIVYEFGARGSLPPVKLTWYDGGKKPAPPVEMGPDEILPPEGVLLRGDKGVIMTSGAYCDTVNLLPDSRMQEFKKNRPPKVLPRVPKANPYLEWITACKGGLKPGSNFIDHSADLAELVHLGNVALRLGRTIEWDPTAGVCVDCPEAEPLLHKQYRLF